MERYEEKTEPLIELGVATTATQGPIGNMIEAAGLWHKAGMDAE